MKKVDILTTSFYPSIENTRFQLACQMIGNAIGVGYDVLVVDGSKDEEIGSAFENLGACAVPQYRAGMGASRRQLFSLARGDYGMRERGWHPARIAIWTEPEKVDLIRLIPEIIAPIERGEADLVVPARTDASFRSYPEPQVVSEKAANTVFAEVTGRELDVMFGPVAFRSDLIDLYAECNPEERFGASDTYIQQIATMIAMSEDRRVVSVPVDFYYPPIQKVEEEKAADAMRDKRRRQFDDLTHAFCIVSQKLGLTKV